MRRWDRRVQPVQPQNKRTAGQWNDDWRLATGDWLQATLNVHFGHLNGPQLGRGGGLWAAAAAVPSWAFYYCSIFIFILVVGAFETCIWCVAPWHPPSLRSPSSRVCSVCVCVCVAGQCSQSSCIASSSLLFCVLDVSACFAFAFYGAKVATCTISPATPCTSSHCPCCCSSRCTRAEPSRSEPCRGKASGVFACRWTFIILFEFMNTKLLFTILQGI